MGKHLILATLALLLIPVASVQAGEPGSESDRAAGKLLYEKHCAQCHGEKGNGDAPAASRFKPAPRDFTSGKYKVRHTATGALPTDEDIIHAIQHGLAFRPGIAAFTAMPPWQRFTDQDLHNLMFYLKTFSKDFADPTYNNPPAVAQGTPPAFSEESAQRGRKVYENNECIKCHGTRGRADGPSAPTLKDDWKNHIRAADLTKRFAFRGGHTREDIYRTVTTGFNGTPMPSYGDTVAEADRWDLVNYVYSLSSRDEAGYNRPDKPVIMKPVTDTLDFSDITKAKTIFKDAVPSYIPVVGQIMEPGRNYHPAVNELEVRAVHNQTDVALMVSWHDMTAEKSGSNGLELEAKEEEAAPAAKPAAENADPFAEAEAADADPFAEESDAGGAAKSKFSDAVAVQLPSKPPEGFHLPYFISGDEKFPADIMFFDLAKDKPQVYIGSGSSKVHTKENTLVTGLADYSEGEWTVVFKRPRELAGSAPFNEQTLVPVAFSVWDGFTEDHGNKRGLTTWYSVYVEPMEKQSSIIPMLTYGGGLLLVELLVIGYVRRKNARVPVLLKQ